MSNTVKVRIKLKPVEQRLLVHNLFKMFQLETWVFDQFNNPKIQALITERPPTINSFQSMVESIYLLAPDLYAKLKKLKDTGETITAILEWIHEKPIDKIMEVHKDANQKSETNEQETKLDSGEKEAVDINRVGEQPTDGKG